MVFAVPGMASAYNTYIGLKIESVNNPNVGSPTEWCLPIGTTMTIKFGEADLNTVTTINTTCSSDTIWSGLVTLDPGPPPEDYTITLTNIDLGGYQWGGYQWRYGTATGDCNSVCANFGGCNNLKVTDPNCQMMKHFYSCTSCDLYGGSNSGSLFMYNTHCYKINPDYYSCSGYYSSSSRHFCTCFGTDSFAFTFTAPAA